MPSIDFMPGKLPGVVLIKPRVFPDDRGFFTETFHVDKYREAGIVRPFVQDNFSFSRRHVLRGLHYQRNRPQGKLVYVASGEIFDVAVDTRRGSPTFGQWEGHRLSGENHHQLYVPEGLAHGFVVLSEFAAVMYKCTELYSPADDTGLRWNDPDIGVAWPVKDPLLSPKDAVLPLLRDLPRESLPPFVG